VAATVILEPPLGSVTKIPGVSTKNSRALYKKDHIDIYIVRSKKKYKDDLHPKNERKILVVRGGFLGVGAAPATS